MAIHKEGNVLGVVSDFVGGALDCFRRDNNKLGLKPVPTRNLLLSRHSVLMDAGYPNEFSLPNLSAFLCEGISKDEPSLSYSLGLSRWS